MQPALLNIEPLVPGTPLPADPLLAGRASLRLEALGLMTAGIVHDIGNMIQVLASTVHALDQHPTVKATKSLRPAIDRAATSLERATALVRQILIFAGEKDDKQESVDLAICLADLERLLRWIGNDKVRIEIRVAAEIPLLFCNQRQLENAILNLALNARDAMPDGGVLSITATTCSDCGITTGLELRISDNGRGMSSETMKRAFDPFFTTKTGGRGNGLGLMMVRRFAQANGGDVTIESEFGVGTAVTLRLPLRS